MKMISNAAGLFIAVLGGVIISIMYTICAPAIAKLDVATMRTIWEAVIIFVICLFAVGYMVKKFR
jgi:uncharacterized membrane protein